MGQEEVGVFGLGCVSSWSELCGTFLF